MKWDGVTDLVIREMIERYHAELMAKLASFEVPMPTYKMRVRGYGYKPMPDLNQFSASLTIDLSKRLSTRAGDANSRLKRVRLNYRLLKDKPKELLVTYGHELAHLIASELYSFRVGHGMEWQKIMVHLGLAPERCHSLDVSELRRKRMRYVYTCKCPNKEFTIGTARHNRFQKYYQELGRTILYCPKCNSGLSYQTGPVYI